MEIEVYEEALKIASEYYLEALKVMDKICDKMNGAETTPLGIDEQKLLKKSFIETWLKEANARLVTDRI